jgi:hypothetical protein
MSDVAGQTTEGGSQGSTETQTAIEGQGQIPAFSVATLPKELATEPYFKGFEGKPVTEVFKSALEAHKLVGGSVRIPGEKAEDKDWDSFYGKLRPESSDKYGLKVSDEKLKPYLPDDKLKAIGDLMWQEGLHPRQAQRILAGYQQLLGADVVNSEQSLQNSIAAGDKAIRDAYAGKYQSAAVMANRVAKRFGGDELVKVIHDYGLNSDKTFFDAFVRIGEAMHEDSWVTGQTSTQFITREKASAQVNEILANKSHAYHDSSHKDHVAACEVVNNLRKIIYSPQH